MALTPYSGQTGGSMDKELLILHRVSLLRFLYKRRPNKRSLLDAVTTGHDSITDLRREGGGGGGGHWRCSQ